MYILCVIFISIILNVHNDPCFEDKSSSLTLKYRPVHFLEAGCISIYVISSIIYIHIYPYNAKRDKAMRLFSQKVCRKLDHKQQESVSGKIYMYIVSMYIECMYILLK